MNLTDILLIVISIALAISLGYNFFGKRPADTASQSPSQRAPKAEPEERVKALQAELDKRSRDLDAQRKQVQELKGELKVNKRKLFEQREAEKSERERLRARTESERELAAQLEQNRTELAEALAEVERLRAAPARGGRPAPAPAAAAEPTPEVAPTPEPPAPAPVPAPIPVAAGPRELNDADRAHIRKLESERDRARQKTSELEKELKRIKGRTEAQARLANASRADAELIKDKYKALEKRLNRTLLEKDLLARAIKDLEQKAGVLAERTELTPEEIAGSDRAVEERASAQAEAEREALARAQAPQDEATVEDAADTAATGVAAETAPEAGAPEALPPTPAPESSEQKV